MLTALLFAATLQPALGPVADPGARTEFLSVSRRIQEALEQGQFDAARGLLPLLPTSKIPVAWDASGIPADQREAFAKARDEGFRLWSGFLEQIQPEVVPNGRAIRFAFVDSFERRPGDPVPPGVRLTFSDSPQGPRLRAVIALRRGNPLGATTQIMVQNEVAHAIGAYLGLSTSPIVGTLMGRTDLNGNRRSMGQRYEYILARNNLAVSEQLRQLVAKRTRVTPARPRAEIRPASFDLGAGMQGAIYDFKITVRNAGNAPLTVRMTPDCVCLNVEREQVIPAGAAVDFAARLDSTEFVGDLRKRVLVMTNDEDQPSRILPVNVKIQPRFRFGGPVGDVYKISDEKEISVLFWSPSDRPIKPLRAFLDGIPARVSFEPWSGEAPDAAMGEDAMPRTGYRFSIVFEGDIPLGTAFATMVVDTDDPAFSSVRYNFTVRKGVVASPDTLYLGEVGPTGAESKFLLSPAARSFKVLKVESTNPLVSATPGPAEADGTIPVVVRIAPNAPSGRVHAVLTVTTDDPQSPELKVVVTAVVR